MMNTNYVILAETTYDTMPFGDAEEQILTVAEQYKEVLERASELVGQVSDDILSGTASTIYLKKLGHRALKIEESEGIINAIGTDSDKQIIIRFHEAQEALVKRLQNTKSIGLLLKQAKIPYDQAYKRSKRPDLWKPEQMIQILEVLKRLQL